MYGVAMAKGLLVTLKNLTKKPFTIQYPEERVKQHPRFRGEEFVWYEERCTGCASCAKYCPLGIIKIVTSPSNTAPAEGDKYLLEVFDIDISRCMFCGLCVEACPTEAITMTHLFELSVTDRDDAMFTKADLLVERDGTPNHNAPAGPLIDLEELRVSDGWMRATSSAGRAEYEGVVQWSESAGGGPESGVQSPGGDDDS